jgi:hypothetical protein
MKRLSLPCGFRPGSGDDAGVGDGAGGLHAVATAGIGIFSRDSGIACPRLQPQNSRCARPPHVEKMVEQSVIQCRRDVDLAQPEITPRASYCRYARYS